MLTLINGYEIIKNTCNNFVLDELFDLVYTQRVEPPT